jgi:cytosine/adenosine deaminase-related metal-dependent hydrolase
MAGRVVVLSGDPFTLTARWVFPVDRPPLARGTVTIAGGRLVAVEPAGVRAADVNLGNSAFLPGFVNAHTHLDLSGLRGRCPPTPDFTGWLRAVIEHRRAVTPEQMQADLRSGLVECLRYGTTLVGDVAAGGASWDALAAAPVRAVVYYELLGLPPDRCAQALDAARAWRGAHPPTPTCRPGWSPHAPYSLAAAGFRDARSDRSFGPLPLATHLAETLAERELLETRCGPFVPFLQELGVWAPDQLARDWDEVLRLTAGAASVAYIHANYLRPDAPFPAGATVVYCPRTHAAFGHPPHPFPEFLARGVRVALGTDSLASNPDLDVLAEARDVHARYPQVPGSTVLRMATLAGAEALGWAAETGSLTAGKSADLVVLPLPDEDRADPHDLVLESGLPVQAVLWRGEWRGAAGAAP